MTVQEIIRVLSGARFPLSNEKLLQAPIQEEFDAHGVEHLREHRLSDADIIDFLVGRVGIEVKIKGTKREIFRQVERYAVHDGIDEIILATNVPMGMPAEINGKAVHVFNLSRAWL